MHPNKQLETNEGFALKLKEIANGGENIPRKVKLSFFVRRIDDIDLVKQRFHVSFHFTASWVEKVGNIYCERGDESRKKLAGSEWMEDDFRWNPQLRFTNLDEETIDCETWYRVMRLDSDGIPLSQYISRKDCGNMSSDEMVYVMRCANHQGWFNEVFELRKFPFDYQLLHIGLTSTWDINKVLLSFDHYRGTRTAEDALTLQSYILHNPRMLAYDEKIHVGKTSLPILSNKSDSVTGAQYNRAYLALPVSRKPNSVLWNVMFIIFLVGTASLLVFTVEEEEIGDRQSSILTLLLTAVAFKYVTVSILPDVPYITYMDWYTLLSIVLQLLIYILVSVTGGTSMSNNTAGDGDDDFQWVWYETWQFLLSAGFWIIVNVVLGGIIIQSLTQRSGELKEWDIYYSTLEKIRKLHHDGTRDVFLTEENGTRTDQKTFFNERLEDLLCKSEDEKKVWIARAMKHLKDDPHHFT